MREQSRERLEDADLEDWSAKTTSHGRLAATDSWNRQRKGFPSEPLEGV